jgi:hypothetical protein
MTVQTMYIGEISTDDCRGALGSLMQIFIMIGILFAYCVGPYVSYTLFQCLTIPLIFAGCFFMMPESPYYYILKGICCLRIMACTLYPFNRIFIFKGQTKEATDSLKFLRGKSEEGVQGELILIQVKRIFSKKLWILLCLSLLTPGGN